MNDSRQFQTGNEDAAAIIEQVYATTLDAKLGRTGKDAFAAMKTIRDLAQKPPAVPFGRPRAVVAPRPEDYGVVRMFELWRDDIRGQLHLVLSMDEAYALLGVRPEDFSQRLFPEQLAA